MREVEMDYEVYEAECERIRDLNNKYLRIFRSELEQKGLSLKTINTHVENIDFYLNDFCSEWC